MTTIFKHKKMPNRLLEWAWSRKKEIDEQVAQLQLESELMQAIVDRIEKEVCQECGGSGSIMKPIKGCECDGPRQHTCEICNGTGEPKP